MIVWHCLLLTAIPVSASRAAGAAWKIGERGRAVFLAVLTAGLLFAGLGDPEIGFDDYSLLPRSAYNLWVLLSFATGIVLCWLLVSTRRVRVGGAVGLAAGVRWRWRIVTAAVGCYLAVVGYLGLDQLSRLEAVRAPVTIDSFAAHLNQLANERAEDLGLDKAQVASGIQAAIRAVDACGVQLAAPPQPVRVTRSHRPRVPARPEPSPCQWTAMAPNDSPVYYAIKLVGPPGKRAIHFQANATRGGPRTTSLTDLVSVPILKGLIMDANVIPKGIVTP